MICLHNYPRFSSIVPLKTSLFSSYITIDNLIRYTSDTITISRDLRDIWSVRTVLSVRTYRTAQRRHIKNLTEFWNFEISLKFNRITSLIDWVGDRCKPCEKSKYLGELWKPVSLESTGCQCRNAAHRWAEIKHVREKLKRITSTSFLWTSQIWCTDWSTRCILNVG